MDFLAFFSNEQGAGVLPIKALDPPHAIDMVKAQYPDAKLAVVPVEAVEGMSSQELLLRWIEGLEE